MRLTRTWPAAVLPLLLLACEGPGQGNAAGDRPVPGTPFRVVTLAEGLEHPWALAFLPGNEGILITERTGRLRWVREGGLDPRPVEGVPTVAAAGQGGLLDIALHPDFAENRLVYLSYAKSGPGGSTTAVARGRFEGGRLLEVHDVFVAEAWGGTTRHFGSRLLFDDAGFLYVTIGDRGEDARAQDLGDHAGTLVRLHGDGSVPPDNPFIGRPDARPEIYTYGHRNAQGMALNPATGEIWLNEHGPRGGDEINRIVPGRNYGWPEVSFGTGYDRSPIRDPEPGLGFEMPLLHWTPSIAPSGMAFYDGDVVPAWRGSLFVGALAGEHLRRVSFDGPVPVEQEELLTRGVGRIRDVRTGLDGLLYLLVDDDDAPLLRIEPDDDPAGPGPGA